MTHLSDEEIMRLAEVTEEQLIYTEQEIEMMNHLKSCTSCYEKFCSSLALLEVTSDDGYVILSEIYGMEYARKLVVQAGNKILAVVNLVRNKLLENMDVILEQVERTGDAFRFHPSLAMATRGLADSDNSVYKVEDINDDKTFIMLDSKSNELLVQINTKELGNTKIRAFLRLESGETREINMELKGKIYKGLVNKLPSEKFQIIIEEAE